MLGLPSRPPFPPRKPLFPRAPWRNPSPLKHKQYAKSMTIAAGFTYQDGVLLCTDSLITVYSNKMLGTKMGPLGAYQWGSAYMAGAGHLAFCTAVYQECREALQEYGGNKPLKWF